MIRGREKKEGADNKWQEQAYNNARKTNRAIYRVPLRDKDYSNQVIDKIRQRGTRSTKKVGTQNGDAQAMRAL